MNETDATTGFQLAQQGKLAEALPYLDRANRATPTNLPLLHAVASVLQSEGRAVDAVARYQRTAALLPDNVEVLSGWARALLLSSEINQMLPLLERALTLDPRYADDGGLLATLLWETDDPDLACEVLQPLVARHPSHIGLLRRYGHALEVAERLQEAHSVYERYRTLQPDEPAVHVELGKLAAMRGDTSAALECYNAALAIDPDRASAKLGITQLGKGQMDPATLAKAQERVQTETDIEQSMALHYALSRHYDAVGEFDAAAIHYQRTNELQVGLVPPRQRYSVQKHEHDADITINNYTPEIFRRLGNAGSAERLPVFIIGLPRSGTTLLERMLAAHPSIVGVGEQSFARRSFQLALLETGNMSETVTAAAVGVAARWHLEQLEDRVRRLGIQRSCERIVDKMPDNYMFAGWLRIAFPNAAIIHCLRDPRDVALSCWQTQFSKISWGYELGSIAHRIEQHRRLMRHWHATIGDHLTEMRYEQLVRDPEPEIRRVLAAIGLAWHPDVLDFANRKGIVRTASHQQVRQPLHVRSVGRWLHYEEALGPILPRLNAIVAQDEVEVGSATGM